MCELSDNDKQKIIDCIEEHITVDAKQIENWIGHLSYISDSLIDESMSDHHASLENLFWIRLFGLIVEIQENFQVSNDILDVTTYDEFTVKYPNLAENNQLLNYVFKILDLISLIKSKFNERELIAIDNYRQTNCHVLQKHYRLKVKTKNNRTSLDENYKVKTIPKSFNVKKLKSELDALIQSYNGSTIDVAIDFAKRINDPVKELYSFYKKLNS
ncbi:MAG: hypothetical protein H6622_08450 [Halobacteriovoraceae bacterium]|nr:hypothetical protein [Halobacteriovoraceae bacterium]